MDGHAGNPFNFANTISPLLNLMAQIWFWLDMVLYQKMTKKNYLFCLVCIITKKTNYKKKNLHINELIAFEVRFFSFGHKVPPNSLTICHRIEERKQSKANRHLPHCLFYDLLSVYAYTGSFCMTFDCNEKLVDQMDCKKTVMWGYYIPVALKITRSIQTMRLNCFLWLYFMWTEEKK